MTSSHEVIIGRASHCSRRAVIWKVSVYVIFHRTPSRHRIGLDSLGRAERRTEQTLVRATNPGRETRPSGNWLNRSATPLERPKQLEGRQSFTDAEVTAIQRKADRLFGDGRSDYLDSEALSVAVFSDAAVYKDPTGPLEGNEVTLRLQYDHRTSLISNPLDGKLPPYTPAGKLRRDAAEALDTLKTPPKTPRNLAPYQRCIGYGIPYIGGNGGSYFQLVQTRDHVVIAMENIHENRIIPLDGRPHLPPAIRLWDGDSVGHWEGQTLVVDTTNFRADNPFYGSSDRLHLEERFTRVAPDEIQQEITVDDPATWTKPWTAMQRLTRTDERIFEVACHEGNAPVMEDMLGAAAKAQH